MDSTLLNISLKTLIAVSPMLGHKLEDRSRISRRQDDGLVRAFRDASRVPLGNPAQKDMFLVAPLDIMVEAGPRGNRFHIIETNGTGIGGLTNLPSPVVGTVLANLGEFAASLPGPSPLVLVAVSGLESSKHPRRNHVMHEKVLYVEALRRGFEERGRDTRILALSRLDEEPSALDTEQPTIVLGYIKEFLNRLGCGADGLLTLHGRPVAAGVNDRFCLNAVGRFGHAVDMTRFRPLNRCYAVGADKGVAYELMNEYARANPGSPCSGVVEFDRADGRAALVGKVVEWLRRGEKAVIKPQGTGLGHGLEFFTDPGEALDSIAAKIDHSIRLTEHYYGAVGGAFPYTVCGFIDSRTIARPGHDLDGHRYELRVVVYREGMSLVATPSIVKVSSQGYDAGNITRLSLINNITTSAEAKRREGTEFMLPLCNRETLELLDIESGELEALCAHCTGYMRHVLDRTQEEPGRFGLAGL